MLFGVSVQTYVKDAKFTVTVIGALLMIINEVLPIVPAGDQHWVTGTVAVLTIISRDITDVMHALGLDSGRYNSARLKIAARRGR